MSGTSALCASLAVLAAAVFNGPLTTGSGIQRVAWLQGCWESASNERVVEEHWMAPRGTSMVGVGRTVRGADLVEYELVVIREQDGRLAYEAHPSGQPTATFLSETVADDAVVFQNLQHDFPKRVGYERAGPDEIVAWIDAGPDSERPRTEFAYKRAACGPPAAARAQAPIPIGQATLAEPAQKTAEVSTDELRRIVAERTATVLDARPFMEYAMSHIPGARNVAAKPGTPMSLYVSDIAEIGRVVNGDKHAPIVLYCNGPHCGKSKRLADELLAAGFTSVRRYQLGIPVWRALGGVAEIEPAGLWRVLMEDKTAVVVDAREMAQAARPIWPGARRIPRSLVLEGKDVGEVKRAKDDGRLPMEDHNTRLIVVGQDAAAARYVAEALAREAFHNVAYLPGTIEQARALLEDRPAPRP
jgi:rhodanese-related sulfurtransferase